MDWVSEAVGEFLAAIGFPGLGLDPQGFVRLRSPSGAALEIQHQRNASSSLMLAWYEPDPWNLSRRLRAGLRLANRRQLGSKPLLCATHEGQLVLATRLRESAVDRCALEENMEWLQRLHEQIRNS